jgi:hypothetical protein
MVIVCAALAVSSSCSDGDPKNLPECDPAVMDTDGLLIRGSAHREARASDHGGRGMTRGRPAGFLSVSTGAA